MFKNYIILTLLFAFQGYPIFSQTQEEQNAEKIYESVDNSIVVIIAYDSKGNMFQGSGVVLDKFGHIATNHHVCKDADRIEIKHYSKEVKDVTIVRYDELKDILILKSPDVDFTPIIYGNSNNLKAGQRIYAVGSPEGYENSISEGIISGFRNDENKTRLIQMTCPITDGSSGGAVVNSKGELIGLSVSGQHEGSLYFAIPVNDVIALLGGSTNVTENNDASQYYKIGTIAKENKNYSEAEVYFTKYLEKFSNDVSAYYNRGYARFKLKEYRNAISDFSTVLDNNGSKESFFYRGNCFYNLKEYQNAYDDYTKAIGEEPDNYDIYFNRGYAAFRLKNYKGAISDWKKAVSLNPEYEKELKGKIKAAEEELN